MKNPNLFLPGFHSATLRRRPRSASQRLADQLSKLRQNSISQLAQCFTGFIPAQLLQPQQSGAQSRQRIFSKENTFWGFFSQILNADGGCSEVVRQFHAVAASRNKPLPSSSTSAYCQARLKLDEYDLASIQSHTSNQLSEQGADNRFLGRRVVLPLVMLCASPNGCNGGSSKSQSLARTPPREMRDGALDEASYQTIHQRSIIRRPSKPRAQDRSPCAIFLLVA